MTPILKQNWSDASADPISEEAIRALHVPQEEYKVYVNEYEAGQPFTIKAGHDFVLYALAGACKTTVSGQIVQLNAGEFIFLAKGAYQFGAVGSQAVQLVRVFSR